MTEPVDEPKVVKEQIIMLDESGNIIDSPERAVRGEIIQTLSDGTELSTIFIVSASEPALPPSGRAQSRGRSGPRSQPDVEIGL